jgi:hypothetical protein
VDGHYGVAAAVDGGFDETHCCFLSALLILVVWFVEGWVILVCFWFWTVLEEVGIEKIDEDKDGLR